MGNLIGGLLNLQSSRAGAGCFVMGLVERNVSAAKEATTNGDEGGGSVRCIAEPHSKGASSWDAGASRPVAASAQFAHDPIVAR